MCSKFKFPKTVEETDSASSGPQWKQAEGCIVDQQGDICFFICHNCKIVSINNNELKKKKSYFI